MIWDDEKIEKILSQIVKDYFVIHAKFPKNVTCEKRKFKLHDINAESKCVTYDEEKIFWVGNINSAIFHPLGARAFFTWQGIAEMTVKLKKKV